MSLDQNYHDFSRHHALGSHQRSEFSGSVEMGPGVEIKILGGVEDIFNPGHKGGVACSFLYITEENPGGEEFTINIPESRVKGFRERHGQDRNKLAKSLAHMVYIGNEANGSFDEMQIGEREVEVDKKKLSKMNVVYKKKGGDTIPGLDKVLHRVGIGSSPKISDSRESISEEQGSKFVDNNIPNLVRYNRNEAFYLLPENGSKVFHDKPTAKKAAKKAFRSVLFQEFRYGAGASNLREPFLDENSLRMKMSDRIKFLGHLMEYGGEETRIALSQFQNKLKSGEDGGLEDNRFLESCEQFLSRVDFTNDGIEKYPNIRVICKEMKRAIGMQKAINNLSVKGGLQFIKDHLEDFSHEDRIEVMNEMMLGSEESRKFMREIADGDEGRFSTSKEEGGFKRFGEFMREIEQEGKFKDFDTQELLSMTREEEYVCNAFIYLFDQERQDDLEILDNLPPEPTNNEFYQATKRSNLLKSKEFEKGVVAYPVRRSDVSLAKKSKQVQKMFVAKNLGLLRKTNGKTSEVFENLQLDPTKVLEEIKQEMLGNLNLYKKRLDKVEIEIQKESGETEASGKGEEETFKAKGLNSEKEKLEGIIDSLGLQIDDLIKNVEPEIKARVKEIKQEGNFIYFQGKLALMHTLKERVESSGLSEKLFKEELTLKEKESKEIIDDEEKEKYGKLLDECIQGFEKCFPLEGEILAESEEELEEILKKFERLERKFIRDPKGKGKCEYIEIAKQQNEALREVQEKLDNIKDQGQIKKVQDDSQKIVKDFEEKHAHEMIYLAMEKNPQCQLLFKVAQFDVRSRKKSQEVKGLLKKGSLLKDAGISLLINKFRMGRITYSTLIKNSRKNLMDLGGLPRISNKQISNFLSEEFHLGTRNKDFLPEDVIQMSSSFGNNQEMQDLVEQFKEGKIPYRQFMKDSKRLFRPEGQEQIPFKTEDICNFFSIYLDLEIPPMPVDIKLRQKALSSLEEIHSQHMSDPEIVKDVNSLKGSQYDFDFVNKNFEGQMMAWGESLQKTWVNHMPLVDESDIVKAESLEKTGLAQESFKRWLVDKTKIEVASFQELGVFEKDFPMLAVRQDDTLAGFEKKLKDTVQEEVVKGRFKEGGHFDENMRIAKEKGEKLVVEAGAREVPLAGKEESFLQKDLLEVRLHSDNKPNFHYEAPALPQDAQAEIPVVDTLAILNQRPKIEDGNYQGSLEDWIKKIADPNNPIEGRSVRILEACTELADLVFEEGQNVPLEIQSILIGEFQDENGKLNLNQMENTKRGKLLTNLLKMNLGVYKRQGGEIPVGDMDYKYLTQFYNNSSRDKALEEMILERLQVVEEPVAGYIQSDLIGKVGEALQNSEIGLRGLGESTILQSIKDSDLERNPGTRTFINNLCRSGGDNLSLYHLTKNLKKMYGDPPDVGKLKGDLDQSIQNREAFARAFFQAANSANRGENQGELKEWLVEVEGRFPKEELNPQLLATPLKIFFADIGRQIGFDEPFDANLKEFNEGLITIHKKDANISLLGFSREISRLSSKIQRGDRSPDVVASLIQYKLGYEFLMTEYFSDKDLDGFLGMEAEAAQEAMSNVAYNLEVLSKEELVLKALEPKLFINQSANGDYKNSCESMLAGYGQAFNPKTIIPGRLGFVNIGYDVELDVVHGHLYIGGSKVSPLPAHLKNHPDIRDLALQDIPYKKVGHNQFVYSVKGDNKIIINDMGEEGVFIRRKLTTEFKKPGEEGFEEKLMMYVPQDKLPHLPRSVANRMDVQSFWYDHSNETISGSSETGELQVQLQKQDQGPHLYKVSTKENKNFVFSNDYPYEPNGILSVLNDHFSDEEILFNPDKSEVWIPSMELKMKMSQQADWECFGKDFDGKVLDIDEKGRLVITNDPKKPAFATSLIDIEQKIREKQNLLDQALDLKAQGKVGKTQERSVLSTKSETMKLEGEIRSLKLKKEKLIGKKYLVTVGKNELINEMENDRGELQLASEILRQNYQTLMEPSSSPPNLEAYAESYENFKLAKEKYKNSHKMPPRQAYFSSTEQGFIESQDLFGALHLASRSDYALEEPLVKEIAKYSLDKPLESKELAILEQTLHGIEGQNKKQLQICLSLLHLQHFQRLNEQHSHGNPVLTKEEINSNQKNAEATKQNLEALALDGNVAEMPNLVHLWKGVSSSFEPDLAVEISKKFPSKEVKESSFLKPKPFPESEVLIESFSSQKGPPIKRLGFEGKVSYQDKDLSEAIQDSQKAVIEGLQTPEQEEGFYWEEFGLFKEESLLDEFRISREGGIGLFSLNQNDVKGIFNLLKDNEDIQEERDIEGNYFSIVPKDEKTLDPFTPEKLRTALAPLALKGKDIDAIVDRLQKFLFKATCARGRFEIAEEDRAVLKGKIEVEQKVHEQQFLEAEAVLNSTLQMAGLDIVDLKCAFLTDNYTVMASKLIPLYNANNRVFSGRTPFEEAGRLRTALARYLFHKTEFQHLENARNAPPSGERNQMELLHTKRSYDTNLLLKTSLDPENPEDAREIEEQRIQMAFLLFEEDYGNRCNVMQAKMFRSFLLSSDNLDSIDAAQARMGFGKTALLPLVALAQVGRGKLVRYIVPRAVLEDNTSSFNERLNSILGSNVIKDNDFSRYHIDEGNKKGSFQAIREDLRQRLTFYKDVRDSGKVLIQAPEIRNGMQAQEDSLRAKLIHGGFESEEEKVLLASCIDILGEIRGLTTYTVSDELDDVQDIKSRETNYTEGEKTQISQESIVPIEQFIEIINDPRGFSGEVLIKEMLRKKGIDDSSPGLLKYLTDRKEDLGPIKGLLQGLSEEKRASVFLIRAFTIDGGMLNMIRDKKPNTHFGVRFREEGGRRQYFEDRDSGSKLLIAVPYEGVNTPKGSSVYDNTEIAAITTIRYYLSDQTAFEQEPHLEFLLKQQKNRTVRSNIAETYGQQAMLKELDEINRSPEEFKSDLKERFYAKYMKEPDPNFRKYFGAAVVDTQIRSDAGRTNSNRYEMGSSEDVNKGCSGTTGNKSSYYENSLDDPAADAKISIEIMGRKNNQTVKRLERQEIVGVDYLDATLDTLLNGMEENTRALIDTAGICKSKEGTPESIVEKLWERLRAQNSPVDGIDGIVYYDRNNIKRVYAGPPGPGESCTQEMEKAAFAEAAKGNEKWKSKYFTFYDQKHTRGCDVKQADGIHALVTVDENVSNSDVKQAILRLRSLVNRDSNQIFSFAITEQMENLIRRELGNAGIPMTPQGEKIKASDIAAFLRHNEKISEENDAVSIFRKEITAHVKQACDHLEHRILKELRNNKKTLSGDNLSAYENFLKGRDQVSSFIQNAIVKLEHKYGGAVEGLNRENFIKSLLGGTLLGEAVQGNVPPNQSNFRRSLDEIFNLAETFAKEVLPQDVVVNMNLHSQKEVYEKRAKKSKEIFESRFQNKNKLISVPKVDVHSVSVNEAQADVQSEALAQKLAEKLAEALAQNDIEAYEWKHEEKIQMTEKRHVQAHLKFLSNMQDTLPLSQVPGMKDLVLEKYRGKFLCSPHLLNAGEPSYEGKLLPPIFFLKEVGGDQRVIFISQEEADLFAKPPKDEVRARFTLHDAEILENQGHVNVMKGEGEASLNLSIGERENIRAATLGENVEKLSPNITSAGIRLGEIGLVNVDGVKKYLPSLTVSDGEKLKKGLNLKGFSLESNAETLIDLGSTADEIVMNIGGIEVKIPKDDKNINDLMNEFCRDLEPLEEGEGVAKKMLTRLEEQQEMWRQKKVELDGKKINMERMRNDLKDRANQVAKFEMDIAGASFLSHNGQGDQSISGSLRTMFKLANLSTIYTSQRDQDQLKLAACADEIMRQLLGNPGPADVEQRAKEFIKNTLDIKDLFIPGTYKVSDRTVERSLDKRVTQAEKIFRMEKTKGNIRLNIVITDEDMESQRMLDDIPMRAREIQEDLESLQQNVSSEDAKAIQGKIEALQTHLETLRDRAAKKWHPDNPERARGCPGAPCGTIDRAMEKANRDSASLKQIIDEMIIQEVKIEALDKEIQVLEAEIVAATKSYETVKNMVKKQGEIEQSLKEKGISFAQEGKFLDMLEFAFLRGPEEYHVSSGIKGNLPEFNKTFQNIKEFSDKRIALNAREEISFDGYQEIDEKTIALAKNLEERHDEIIRIPIAV